MKRHQLVIAAIFKDENSYLEEWIEYHHLVGCDHFYLYDNDGSDEARKILAPFQRAGLVTRHDWTHLDGTRLDRTTRFGGRDKNHAAFGHAAKHYRENFGWIMKIDIDEFLQPLDDDNVPSALARYDRGRVKAIRIPRVNFGNNGHLQAPPGLVIESYTRREETSSDHKDLGNSRFLSSNTFTNSAHSWGLRWFKRGRVINEREITNLRVNHYYTKSLQEYLGRQNTMRSRPQTDEGFEEKNRGRNEVMDQSMLRFAAEIKRRMPHASLAP